MQGLYDLMLMLDPTVPEERRAEILQQVQAMIESEGSVVGSHDWGTRRMTFEIDHRPEASYHLYQFEGESPLLERLDHTLKITDGVMRFRTIGIKPGSPPPDVPQAEAPRSREESGDSPRAPRAAADSRRD